ncbi:MAG: hypothetical protein K2V38_24725, partial [Gemmataceae bacterium]|nr:hypothetical protein [Gemmataceae bacterium]
MRPLFACALVSWGLLAPLVAGCLKAEHVGPFTTDKTPDGQPFVITFPGKPEWDDIPDLDPPTKGFVWRGDGNSKPCEAWVWTISPEDREKLSWEELTNRFAHRAQLTNGEGAYVFSRSGDEGDRGGGWTSAPPDGIGRRWPTSAAGAGYVRLVGDKVYCMRVRGSDLKGDEPDVKAFFESLKPAELAGRPPAPQPPADDLRPLAWFGPFTDTDGYGRRANGV